jgi:hypothetical protein
MVHSEKHVIIRQMPFLLQAGRTQMAYSAHFGIYLNEFTEEQVGD